jgi:hypothetical protein
MAGGEGMSESASITIERPINDAQLTHWDAQKKRHARIRATILPVIEEACRSNGLALIDLNVRPSIIGRRMMSDEPDVRTCLICGESVDEKPCWVFIVSKVSLKYIRRRRAVHAKCMGSATEDA